MMTTPEVPTLPDQGIPSDEVIDALIAGIVRINRRAEIYERDGVTPMDIERFDARLTGGEVGVDAFRDERRICDLTFDNHDSALDLDPYDGFYYDKVIKVFWGIKYYTGSLLRSWETQIGEFMIDQISEDYFPNEVKITGRDYAKKCLQSKLTQSMSFPQYTPIEAIIRAIATNAGVTKFSLPYTGQGYARDAAFERGTERWKVIRELGDSIGYEVYFTGDGYLTMRPYGDPIMSPLKWIFRPGPLDGTLVKYERSTNDSRIKNHIVVTGANIANLNGFNQAVWAEAVNDDPGSPTRRERIGDRVDFYESEFVTDVGQAQAIANQRLRVGALEEYLVNFSSVIIPWLDAGDIVDVVDYQSGDYVPRRFLLTNFSFPLALEAMTATARRVTMAGTTQNLEYE
jgi:hypothetical protein